MLRIFTLILISICALALSCSRQRNDNSNTGENGQIVNFAEITDANQALTLGNQYLEDNKTELAIEALTPWSV
jgi:hypothetical protein